MTSKKKEEVSGSVRLVIMDAHLITINFFLSYFTKGQSQHVWHKDSDDLCYLIDQIYEGRTLDELTTVCIEKYKSFLQSFTNSVNICHEDGKISNISLVRFYMFSNSTFWSSKEKVQLIANVYTLHKDEIFDMIRAFTAQFGNWKYDDWQCKVDNHVVFKAVKNYQQNKRRLRQGRSPQNSNSCYTTAESLLLYVHDCTKHYWEHAKRLQQVSLITLQN